MAFQVKLSKERFKFSATHFTIFNKKSAEALHGHNYQVSADLYFKSLAEDTGLSAEFSHLKNKIDSLCEELDEKVLLPEKSPFLSLNEKDDNWEVTFNERFYSFPKLDCVVLQIVNISSECLAKYLYGRLKKEFLAIGLDRLSVTVEESRGQAVTYFE